MDHASLIEQLGGPNRVAEALGCHRTAVVFWRTKGIPPTRFLEVVDLAAQAAVPGVTLEALHLGMPALTPRGGARRFSGYIHPDARTWASLRRAGMSVMAIARKAGVSDQTVRMHLQRLDDGATQTDPAA